MIVYTRMGWLVPAIWLGALAFASQLPAAATEDYGMGLSRVAFMFFTTAVVSTPLLFLAAAVLNREKVTHTVRQFGRERQVTYGPHTFNMAPIGFYAYAVPIFTVAFYFLFKVLP